MKDKDKAKQRKETWGKIFADKETYLLAKEWLMKVYHQPSRLLHARKPKGE